MELKKIENDDVLDYVGFVAAKYCVPEEAFGHPAWEGRGEAHGKECLRIWYNGLFDKDEKKLNEFNELKTMFGNYMSGDLPKLLEYYGYDVEKMWMLLMFMKKFIDAMLDSTSKSAELSAQDHLQAIYDDLMRHKQGRLRRDTPFVSLKSGDHEFQIRYSRILHNFLPEIVKLALDNENHEYYDVLFESRGYVRKPKDVTKTEGRKRKATPADWAKVKLFLELMDYFLKENGDYVAKHGKREDWEFKVEMLLVVGYIYDRNFASKIEKHKKDERFVGKDEDKYAYMPKATKAYGETIREGIKKHKKFRELKIDEWCLWYLGRHPMEDAYNEYLIEEQDRPKKNFRMIIEEVKNEKNAVE